MTLPREVLPGRFYMLTRRCTQRQFLLRPDTQTNNAFIYCMAEAAQRTGIEIILPVAMSNHYHAIVYDRLGTVPQFTEHFHKMFAKCQNAHRGRWENFWSSEQVCVVRLVGENDVLDKLVYVATNPVKDHLVEHVHHWPGVNGLGALLNQRRLKAHRPAHFFRAGGSMPKEVELELTIPAELGDANELRRQLRAMVTAKEESLAKERLESKRRIIGRPAILKQSWWDSPTTFAKRRNLRPQIAARSEWARIEAIRRNREFVEEYAAARERWVVDRTTEFPAGTYWLKRFANVLVAS